MVSQGTHICVTGEMEKGDGIPSTRSTHMTPDGQGI
jgi:hypothetical protein